MRRAQRFLVVAFALSLLLHAIVALILHPAHADFQNQTEVVSIVRRSSIAVAKQTPPPPKPRQTPAPHRGAVVQPRARTASSVGPSGGGRGKATPVPTPPPATAPPKAASAACASPEAAATVAATPGPPNIPPEARTEATSGLASVQVQLDATGQVLSASVAQSTGNSSLDLVAVSMARQARYDPPLHDCKPIAGSATFSVKFVAW
ncbi:MAG TPA: TonB family protein [Candidatus Cybelea sp.]|jgi:TonB family protein|nr:TonB family protein [Candidatus Cybelea sp.]